MQQKFDQETYGQRWQVETVFSMIKRNQGEALPSKTYWANNREMMLKVLTHNIGIILLVNELFYRAYRTPLFRPKPKPEAGRDILAERNTSYNSVFSLTNAASAL